MGGDRTDPSLIGSFLKTLEELESQLGAEGVKCAILLIVSNGKFSIEEKCMATDLSFGFTGTFLSIN